MRQLGHRCELVVASVQQPFGQLEQVAWFHAGYTRLGVNVGNLVRENSAVSPRVGHGQAL